MLDNGTALAARPFDLKLERQITMRQANEIQSFALPEETRARTDSNTHNSIGDAARTRLENPRWHVIDPLIPTGTSDPRARQLRDEQQSCGYPTPEYQLDRPSSQCCPPRPLSGSFQQQENMLGKKSRGHRHDLTQVSHINVKLSGVLSLRVRWSVWLGMGRSLTFLASARRSYGCPCILTYSFASIGFPHITFVPSSGGRDVTLCGLFSYSRVKSTWLYSNTHASLGARVDGAPVHEM